LNDLAPVSTKQLHRLRPVQLCGETMIRISLAYPYELGLTFARLRESLREGIKLNAVRYGLLEAEEQLGGLFHPTGIYVDALRGATHDANVLFEAIKKLTTDPDHNRDLDFFDVYSISSALDKFEAVLTAELRAADAYFVNKKGGYDTIDLIVRAEVLFPSGLMDKVPNAVHDIQEAGRCIAFELGTAAGFHTMRALETIVKSYWKAISGNSKPPGSKTIGAFIRQMEENNIGNKKVVSALKQIKDLHRNPLTHTQVTLEMQEAIDLLGIVRSAVSAMLAEIPSERTDEIEDAEEV